MCEFENITHELREMKWNVLEVFLNHLIIWRSNTFYCGMMLNDSSFIKYTKLMDIHIGELAMKRILYKSQSTSSYLYM